MSKKRSSPETSTDDEHTNEAEESDLLQRGDDVKRPKLASLSDTTLQDLPLELIERIFVRAIVMEVENLHMAKSAWKEKGRLVLSRLRTVCPEWSSILTTNFFQNELYRTLDRTVEKTNRLEILHQSQLHFSLPDSVTFQGELFMLRRQKGNRVSEIQVYDPNNLAVVKDVIDLSGFDSEILAACDVSNCLYLLNWAEDGDVGVLRIAKEDEHKYSLSPLVSAHGSSSRPSVAANGNSVRWTRVLGEFEQSTQIIVCDATGSLLHKIELSSDAFEVVNVIPKTNGTLVVVSWTQNHPAGTTLTEIDVSGAVLRQYQSSLGTFGAACLPDTHGRIVIMESLNRIELLDNEFNLLNVVVPQSATGVFQLGFFSNLHYNSETNEFLIIWIDLDPFLSIFHLTEK